MDLVGHARTGPLTRIQTELWLSLYWQGHDGHAVTLSDTWELGEGYPESAVRRVFQRLCDMHEILRTSFRIGVDGQPEQVVTAASEFIAPIFFNTESSATGVEDPGLGGADSEVPLWKAIGRLEEGSVRTIAVYFRHIIIDRSGVNQFRGQFMRTLEDGTDELARLDIVQPLDRPVRAVRRRLDNDGPEHVRLGRPAQSLVPLTSSSEAHSHHRTSCLVEDMGRLLRAISHEAGVSVPIIAKFAVAWSLCQYSRQADVLLSNVVYHGRFGSPAIDCQMSNLMESFHLDGKQSFGEALAAFEATTADTYGSFGSPLDSFLIDFAGMLGSRGIGLAAPVYFDFIGTAQRDPSRRPDPHRVHHTPTSTPLKPGAVNCFSPVIAIEELDGERVKLDVLADDRVMSPRLAAELGTIMRRILVHMDTLSLPVDSADSLFPEELRLAADSQRVAGRWLSQDLLLSVVREIDGVVDCSILVEDQTVVADLALRPGTEIFYVYERICESLADSSALCAPDVYRWTWVDDDLGASAGSAQPRMTWSRAEGIPTLECSTPEEDALIRAVSRVNRIPTVNSALSYIQAGGIPTRAPAVVKDVEAEGFLGLRREHFTTPLSLRAVARSLMRPVGPRLDR